MEQRFRAMCCLLPRRSRLNVPEMPKRNRCCPSSLLYTMSLLSTHFSWGSDMELETASMRRTFQTLKSHFMAMRVQPRASEPTRHVGSFALDRARTESRSSSRNAAVLSRFRMLHSSGATLRLSTRPGVLSASGSSGFTAASESTK